MQRRSVINASLFDVFSVLMTDYERDIIIENSDKIKNIFYDLMDDEQFVQAITRGTNDQRRVKTRFSMVLEAFQEI